MTAPIRGLVLLMGLVACLALPSVSYAASMTCNWDPNPASDNVIGYRVYVGTTPGTSSVPGSPFDVSQGGLTTFVFNAATPGVTYYFSLSAYNEDGESPRSAEVSGMVTVDTPPVVSISAPTAAATFATRTAALTLGGTATDTVGVTRVTWRNSNGGATGTATLGGTPTAASWSASVTLRTGSNVLTVTARDSANNTSTDTLTVTLDATAPVVTITTPTSAATFAATAAAFTIGGASTDAVGVTQVTWSNANGGATGVATLGGSATSATWSASLTLQSGSNVLTVTARDAANGSSTDTLTVTLPASAPTVTTVSPLAGSTAVAESANVTGTFSGTMTAATLTTTTVTLVRQGTTTPVAAAVTYAAATNTVTLNPTPTLASGALYTVTVKGGATGVKDSGGRQMAADKVWTFTTAAPSTATYLSDRAWSTMSNGWGSVEKDRSNGESGAADGLALTINGVVYAKGLGAHAASDVRYALNGTCSALTAVVGVDDEVGSDGSVVFQVWADGVKKYDSGVMTGPMPGAGVNVNLTGVTQLALIMTDGGNGDSSDHGDWANAQLTCGVVATAPTVTTLSPLAGATRVSSSANVTGVFSTSMTASTVTAATVTLMRQGATTPTAAVVSYAAATNTVKVDPTGNLAAGTLYTVTIKGGPTGVKNTAGTAMAADKVWTFTTNGTAPGTTSYLSDRTWSAMSNGYGSVEKDRSNGESGDSDGLALTLNGVVYAKGLGAHSASDVRYALNGTCSLLSAVAGVDDEVGSDGTVVFQVWTDGVKKYDSGVMTGSMPGAAVSVNLTGVRELALIITDGGDGDASDHGDWAGATVTCST